MITHGHGDVKFSHYALELYLENSNYIGTFAKHLCNLGLLHARLSRLLFEKVMSTPLHEAALDRKYVYIGG